MAGSVFECTDRLRVCITDIPQITYMGIIGPGTPHIADTAMVTELTGAAFLVRCSLKLRGRLAG
jgi:hypothetical protein